MDQKVLYPLVQSNSEFTIILLRELLPQLCIIVLVILPINQWMERRPLILFQIQMSIWYSAPLVVLPIILQDFTVQEVNNKVQILWQTASEQNAAFFSVERSEDATSFTEIARLSASAPQGRKYVAKDESPLKGKAHYRLKMVNKDGTFTYSDVKSVEFKQSAFPISQ